MKYGILNLRKKKMMLNYDDSVVIKIIKVKDETGKFSHWESDTRFNEEYYGGGSTGPDFFSVVDNALEYIKDTAQFWMSDDANNKK